MGGRQGIVHHVIAQPPEGAGASYEAPAGNAASAPGGFLTGSRILVTGAASGIGLAVAVGCLSEGAEVVLLDRDGPALQRAIEFLGPAERAHAHGVQADVSDAGEVRAAVAEAASPSGRLGAVVTAAGVGGYTGDIGQTTLAEWTGTLAVNLSGIFYVCREALPLLRANGGGRIVTVSSQYGLVGGAGSPAYSAAKAGVIGLTRAMAVDHAAEGILVNCVCPGPIDTPMLRASTGHGDLARREASRTAGRVLLGGPGRPEDVAGVIAFLLGPHAGFMTGSVIPCDGGWTAALSLSRWVQGLIRSGSLYSDGSRRLECALSSDSHRQCAGRVARSAHHCGRISLADGPQEAAHRPLKRLERSVAGDRLALAHAREAEVRVERQPQGGLGRDNVEAVGAGLARPGPRDHDRRQCAGSQLEHDREGIVNVPGIAAASGQPDPARRGLNRHHLACHGPGQIHLVAAALQQVPAACPHINEPGAALCRPDARSEQEPDLLALEQPGQLVQQIERMPLVADRAHGTGPLGRRDDLGRVLGRAGDRLLEIEGQPLLERGDRRLAVR